MSTDTENPTIGNTPELVTKPRLNLSELPSLSNASAPITEPATWPAKEAGNYSSPPPPPTSLLHNNLKINGAAKETAANNQEETVKLVVPNSSRSAIIGTRGTNLRKIQTDFNAQIELEQVQSPWSMGVTEVTLVGSRANVPQAKAAVYRFAAIPQTVSSIRRIPAHLTPFLSFSEKWGSLINKERNLADLKGSFDEVLQQMSNFDADLETVASSLETKVITIPEDKPEIVRPPVDLLMDKAGATITSQSGREFTIYAPQMHIRAAINAFNKFVNSQVELDFDLTKCSGCFTAHARMLTRFFAITKEIEEIANDTNVHISGPFSPEDNQGVVVYKIKGDRASVDKAKKAMIRLVDAHSPREHVVIRNMRFPLCRALVAETLNELNPILKAVWSDSDELYIMKNREASAATKEECRKELMDLVEDLSYIEDIASSLTVRTVEVEDSSAAVDPRGPEAKKVFSANFVPISNTKEMADSEDKRARISAVDQTTVAISGTKESVAEAIAELHKIIKLSKAHDVLSSHTVDIPFEQELIPSLVGKNGAQINRLRKEFDVDINANKSGKISIKGIEANVRDAISAITELQKKLRDLKTEELDIAPEYFRKLIGPGGRYVRRLSEQHSCDIRIPPINNDTPSPVVIRGPSKGVSAIKREFMELVAYEIEHSYTEELEVPEEAVPRIVGKSGSVMGKISHETGADIKVDNKPIPGKQSVKVEIKGRKNHVDDAISHIQTIVDSVAHFTEERITILPLMVKALSIELRSEMIEKAGGDPTSVFWSFNIIPRQNIARVSGNKDIVANVKQQLEAMRAELEEKYKVTKQVPVPVSRIKFVIGSGGSRLQEIENEFEVSVDTEERKNGFVNVVIKGANDDLVNKAEDAILQSALPYTREIEVLSKIWTPDTRRFLSLPSLPVRFETIKSGKGPDAKTTLAVCCKTEEDCEKFAKALEPLVQANVFTSFEIDNRDVAKVIGPKGATIKNIRRDCGAVSLVIESSGVIEVCGTTETVSKAQAMVNEAISAQ